MEIRGGGWNPPSKYLVDFLDPIPFRVNPITWDGGFLAQTIKLFIVTVKQHVLTLLNSATCITYWAYFGKRFANSNHQGSCCSCFFNLLFCLKTKEMHGGTIVGQKDACFETLELIFLNFGRFPRANIGSRWLSPLWRRGDLRCHFSKNRAIKFSVQSVNP